MESNESYFQIDYKSLENMTSLYSVYHYTEKEMKRIYMKQLAEGKCKQLEEKIMIHSMDMERKIYCIFIL